MNKEQLVKESKSVFEEHTNAKVVFATTDGQFFLEKARGHAVNYANSVGREVIEITREEATGKSVAENGEDPDIADYSIAQLKDFAALNGIEITKSKKADILLEVTAGLEKLNKAVEEEE